MHELSIALSILDVASEKSATWDEVPCAIHMRLGPLSGVVKEALQSAFRLATEDTAWASTELVINDVPLVGWCTQCAQERPVASVQELVCSECGQPMTRIISGEELELTHLEIAQ